jgi:hypothetical protein
VVNAWKVILAAAVIFAAGVVTGALSFRLKSPEAAAPVVPLSTGPLRQRMDLLDRMQRRLYLTPPQREHIEKILRESHERMKLLWDSIAPQAQEEHRRVHELIRNELTAEQQSRFEEMLKSRGLGRGAEERRRLYERREGKSRRPDTSRSASPKEPAKPDL